MNSGATSDFKSTWTDSAISNACSSTVWSDLVNCINAGISKSLTDEGFRRFAELTEQEQAVIVEREIFKLQQSENSNLRNFRGYLNRSIDDELIRHIKIMSSNDNSPCHSSNVQQLVEITSQAIKEVLQTSPPEMKNTLILFLNSALPATLRSYVWSTSLTLSASKTELNSIPVTRVPPSLDVLYLRHCHLLLDRYFAEYSSRQKASTIKSVVFDFLRRVNLPLPSTTSTTTPTTTSTTTPTTTSTPADSTAAASSFTHHFSKNRNSSSTTSDLESFNNMTVTNIQSKTEEEMDSFEISDQLLFLLVPLSISKLSLSPPSPSPPTDHHPQRLATSKEGRRDIKRQSQHRSNNSYEDTLLQLLFAICGSRHLDLLHEEGGGSSSVDRKKLQRQAKGGSGSGDAAATAAFPSPTPQEDEGYEPNVAASAAAAAAAGGDAGGDRGVGEITAGLKGYSSCLQRTQAILAAQSPDLSSHLKALRHVATSTTAGRGDGAPSPSGPFDVRSDNQGFNTMLPLVLVSLLLESRAELLALELLSSAVDSFESFCRCVTVTRLQRLLVKYFDSELKGWLTLSGTPATGNTTATADGLLGGTDGGSHEDIIHRLYPALLPPPPPLHPVPSVAATLTTSSPASDSSDVNVCVTPSDSIRSSSVVVPAKSEGDGDSDHPPSLTVMPTGISDHNNNNSSSIEEAATSSGHSLDLNGSQPTNKSNKHIDTFQPLLPPDTEGEGGIHSTVGVSQDGITVSSAPPPSSPRPMQATSDRDHQLTDSSTTTTASDPLLAITEHPFPPLSVASPTPSPLTTMPAAGAPAPSPAAATAETLSGPSLSPPSQLADVDKNSSRDRTEVNVVATSGVGVVPSSQSRETVTPAGTKTSTTGTPGLFNMFKRK